MPGVRMLFTGGEISPEMYGRTDMQRFGVSQRTVLNFLLTPAGAAKNRPGTKYVNDAISNSVAGRLIPFVVSSDIAYMLELADGKMRFHTDGATVTGQTGTHSGPSGATLIDPSAAWQVDVLEGKTVTNTTKGESATVTSNSSTRVNGTLSGGEDWDSGNAYEIEGAYEIEIPWSDADLPRLKFAQFNDIMVIVHQDYQPYVLRRYAEKYWTLTPYNIARTVLPPTDLAENVAGTGGSPKLWEWVVTSVGRDGRESLISEPHTDLTAHVYPDTTQTLEYKLEFKTPPEGAIPARYNVYRGRDGAYGFVGDMEATEDATPGTTIEIFTDRGHAPDYGDTPPEGRDPFEFSYPATGGEGLPREVAFGPPGGSPLRQAVAKDEATEAFNKTYTISFDVTFASAGTLQLKIEKHTGGVGWTLLENYGIVATGATTIRVTRSYVIDGFAQDSGYPPGANLEQIAIEEVSATGGATWLGDEMHWSLPSGETSDVRTLYPATVCFFEQRAVFGGFSGEPSTFKMSRSGDFFNFDRSLFTKDDDSIELTLASSKLDEIRSVIPLRALMMFTAGAEWVVRGTEGGPMTPGSFDLKPDSWYGASWVDPVVIGRSVIYMTERGRVMRDFQYDPITGAIAESKELTILARHLMEFYGVTSMAYAEVPHSALWAVREDGVLLGLTYIREHDVWGWHRHYTGPGTITTPNSGYRQVSVRDKFEDVASIPEEGTNAVYVLVKRTIDGGTVRYLERFTSREGITDTADYVFMDSAISFDGRNTGAETMALSGGSTWIAGEEGLTLTRSVDNFAAGDVGTVFEIRDSAGLWVRVEITAQGGGLTATCKINSHITDNGETEVPNTLRVGDGEYEGPFTDWGQAFNTFSGLDHLEGEDVAVLVDGGTHDEVEVVSGVITLDTGVFAERIHVGLAVQSDIETLHPNFDNAPPEARIQRKAIQRIGIEVDNLEGLLVGQYMGNLVPADERVVDEGYGAADPDRGIVVVRPDGHDFNRETAAAFRQASHLPTTLLSVVLDLEVEKDEE